MDFYAVLDQAVELLRTRGRVSYRALKENFDLDTLCSSPIYNWFTEGFDTPDFKDAKELLEQLS